MTTGTRVCASPLQVGGCGYLFHAHKELKTAQSSQKVWQTFSDQCLKSRGPSLRVCYLQYWAVLEPLSSFPKLTAIWHPPTRHTSVTFHSYLEVL